MKVVSACLVGVNCKYNGKNNENKKVIDAVKQGQCILICPEQLGGLTTPRPPAQIQGKSGEDVLNGTCKIVTDGGKDVTEGFVNGAKEALKIAKLFGCKEAILKHKSPSCGCGIIHDGSFTGKLKEGDGITTALFKKNGIKCMTEEDL